MRQSNLVQIISISLMILFLYTGISKLLEMSIFEEQLTESKLLKPFAQFITWTLPIIEFTIVILLFVPVWRFKGLYASFILMLFFTIYVIILVCFSNKLPCSCGGVIEELTWPQHIFFNCFFTFLALLGIKIERKNINTSLTNKKSTS